MNLKTLTRSVSLLLALMLCISVFPAYGAEAATESSWKMQKFGGSTDLEVQEGWLTPTESGFILDYGKVYAGNGGSVAVYDASAPSYKDSILEFDLESKGTGVGSGYRFAVFPRFQDGRNCDGMAIDSAGGIQHSFQVGGSEGWPGVSNDCGASFVADTVYRLKLITAGDTLTAYVDGVKLTSFTMKSEITGGSYGFRIWGQTDDKVVTVSNITRAEYISSSVNESTKTIKAGQWGADDVLIPVTFGAGDSVLSVKNGGAALEQNTDYTVSESAITLKKGYIEAQEDTFTLDISFAGGSTAAFRVIKYDPTVHETVWTPKDGVDPWQKISGGGSFAMEEGGLRITGDLVLVNTDSPIAADCEIELIYTQLNDDANAGFLFRADKDAGTWQAVLQDNGYMQRFYFRDNTGKNTGIHGDCSFPYARMGYADHKLKARIQGDTVTLWIDDQFMSTTSAGSTVSVDGLMGLYTGGPCDILLKSAVMRSTPPVLLEEDDSGDIRISSGGMSVRLAADFPRVKDYTLNGKTLSGAEFKYNLVTVNATDYPATAVLKAETGDSAAYAVSLQGCDVTFDVVFTVLPGHILDMRITNITEPTVKVNSVGFPNQPLISASDRQSGARLDATVFAENIFTGSQWDQTTLADRHYVIAENKISKTVNETATIPIVTTDELSASMANNVLYNIHEFQFRAFDLPGGGISAGVWNTDFVYRGLDGERILPDEELYCQVVVTEDTNEDGGMDWQDGANALKTIIQGKIPGGDTAARSFFQVGYNFSSQVQHPFLKVADNMKRMGNLIDGFSQILVFKGYANEGHDSGHADYDDVNRRAGGAEDMRVLTEEAAKINSVLGIHINNSEAYPEAKMFTSETMTDKDAWAWMDQSKSLRREVDILNGGMDARLDSLFDKVPGIGFVYVDTYGDDRWCAARLANNLISHDVIIGTENKIDLDRYASWVHWPEVSHEGIHGFVYQTQKDVYTGSNLFWGGYSRSPSFMSWQHSNNITPIVEQFYTNQLPQKYLMCHDVRKMTSSRADFTGNVYTTSDRKIYKDGNLIADGSGKIFIPWYSEDSATKDPDEAFKIYHWNAGGGETTWHLPASWAGEAAVKLYKTTQTGKVLVDTLKVTDGQVTINAAAKTPYVIYKGDESEPADITEWSVGSPIRDTSFNSRDFSIWQKSSDGESTGHIKLNDDGNGVSILTIEGAEDGQVYQTMTGLIPGQKYRVLVWAGAENGKTARLTVETPDGGSYANYVERVVMVNRCFDTYAENKMVQQMWVDFTPGDGQTTAKIILSADASGANGKATFMETRIVKTDEPDLPRHFAAYETFEYVEQGGAGIFAPESRTDGGYHLSETHLPYTADTISGDWSLKKQGTNVRTSPATMRLLPNAEYTMEFDTLQGGTVYIVSEADSGDQPLKQTFSAGHSKFTFTTGSKTDYIARIEGGYVLDNFQVYRYEDDTPPTTPENLSAFVEDNARVVLTWAPATDPDSPVTAYKVYRNGELHATLGAVTAYTDSSVSEYTGYFYQVSAVNAGGTEGEKSPVCTAYVGTDLIAPNVLSAELTSISSAVLIFSETLDPESAEMAENYRLSAGYVTGSALQPDGKTVVLTLEGMSATDTAVLQVAGVKDRSAAGNATVGDQALCLSAMAHYFKFDEEPGEPAYDFTRREDGVKASSVKTREGVNGAAAGFNADGYVELSGQALFRKQEITLSAWIKWDGVSGESQTIFSNGPSGDSGSYGLWFHVRTDSRLWISYKNNAGGYTDLNSGSALVPTDRWVHVAFVKHSGGGDLYLDGQKVASDSRYVDVGDHNGKIRIGGNYNGSNALLHKFKGGIDEFKLYTAALTAEEISAIAETTDYPPAVFGSRFTVALPTLWDMEVRLDYNGATLSRISAGDAMLLEGSDYVTTPNSVVFSAAYLSTLTPGEHALTLDFGEIAFDIVLNAITVTPPVDRTALMAAIFTAQQFTEDDCPAELWLKLQDALAEAIKISEKQDLTAEEVAAAAAALQTVIDQINGAPSVSITLSDACRTLTAGYTARIVAAVKTENTEDEVFVALFKDGVRITEPAAVVDGEAAFYTPVIEKGSAYTVEAFFIDGPYCASQSIAVYVPSATIWKPDSAVIGDTVYIYFSEAIKLLKTAALTVNGVPVNEFSADSRTVSFDKFGLAWAEENIIVISGVAYPGLFPSYSFTFTVRV